MAHPESIFMGKGIEMVSLCSLLCTRLPSTLQTFLRNDKYITRMTISGEPGADPFDVPSHWHETHDEYMLVVEGKLEITLGSTARIYTPDDGEVHIPKGTSHSLKGIKGVSTVVQERTDPMVREATHPRPAHDRSLNAITGTRTLRKSSCSET